MWRGCFGVGFGWVIPLIFLGVFLYLVFFRRWGPPFWGKPYSKIIEGGQQEKKYRKQEQEKERLEEKVEELKTELSYLREKVKNLEEKN